MSTTVNNAITSTSGASSSPQTSSLPQNTLGKDDFLKIFLAQLSQQDPTAPVDSQAFVAQLAQFSTLELQQNANTDLESLMMGQAAAEQTAMTGMVGKDVTYTTNSVSLTAGQSASIGATLGSSASSVTAIVTDANGKSVRTITLGAQPAGTLSIPWDGRDGAGTPLPSGRYTVSVTAADPTGASVPVTQTGSGQVTGIAYANGSSQLMVGSTTIPLSNVTQITERTTP
jgi:flagellar basal-body rod modification protein FlgD